MTKRDIDKVLNEEFGFNVMSILDFGQNVVDSITDKYDEIFKVEDIEETKIELDKGYFSEIYNEYSKIENPTEKELTRFRDDLIGTTQTVCEDIKNKLNKYIQKTKSKITKDKLKEFLDEK